MKNLLLEALRQSQGESQDDGEDAAAQTNSADQMPAAATDELGEHDRVGAPDDETVAQAADVAQVELGLMRTGQFIRETQGTLLQEHAASSVVAAEDSTEPLVEPTGDGTSRHDIGGADNADGPEPVVESREDATPGIDPQLSSLSLGSERQEQQRVWTQRYATWLWPALFVIAALASAATALVGERLSLTSVADGAADLSGRDRFDADSASQWQDIPITDINVFSGMVSLSDGYSEKWRPAASTVALDSSVETELSVASAVSDRASKISAPRVDAIAIEKANEESMQGDPAFTTIQLGFAAYYEGRYDDALEFYQRALQIEPNHRDALIGHASTLAKLGRPPAAIDAYERMLQIFPNDSSAIAALVTLYSDAGDDAESELKLLLQQYPAADALHYALGTLHASKQRWADASHAFQSARDLNPSVAKYNYNLAICMQHLGQYGRAEEYFSHALATLGSSSGIDRDALQQHLGALRQSLQHSSQQSPGESS